VAQRSGSSQAAVDATSIGTFATSAAVKSTTTTTWGFSTSTIPQSIEQKLNSVITRQAAVITLINELRAVLSETTGIGAMKGSA